jgi:hypothetical protein
MTGAVRTGRKLYEAIAWSLIGAGLIVLILFMGVAAASDLSKRGTSNCRKALGLTKARAVTKAIDKSFSFSPLGWKCTYEKGGRTIRSFVKL